MGKGIRDRQVNRDAIMARVRYPLSLVTAVSQTDTPYMVHRPGYKFLLQGVEGFCSAKAGSVTHAGVIVPNGAGIITATALSVHSTPTQFALTAFKAMANGVVVLKGAASALTFSAAHVVSANTFGVILIQMDSAGTISTKVPLATQAYASAGDAIRNLPAADAGKVAIGYFVIDALTGSAWTANTSNMTAAGGLDAITIVNTAALARAWNTAAFTALTPVAGTLGAVATLKGGPLDYVVLLYTTDGTGALTNGYVKPYWRPYPMNED